MLKMTVILAVLVAVGTVLYGVKAMKMQKTGNVKNAILASVSLFGAMVFSFVLVGSADVVLAATDSAASTGVSFGQGLQYIAAALSTGLATIGTGKAVGSVGSSAIGAVSEDPTILGKTLIFVGMAEGIAIYGMIISILILFI